MYIYTYIYLYLKKKLERDVASIEHYQLAQLNKQTKKTLGFRK